MIFIKFLPVAAIFAGSLDIALGASDGRLGAGSHLSPRRNDNTPSTCLAEQAIQTASFSDGQGQNDQGVKPGQAKSETSQNNFIDACDGQTLTNGLQNLDGSCNPIPMGEIPSFQTMVSTIITSPQNVDDLEANTAFDIKLQVINLAAGFFTNPDITYYTAPQRLDGAGRIIGHVHVTVQDIGQANPGQPPDPKVFRFFKGIDDAGDNQGGLKATAADGLPEGFYRICTMVAARNHQPVTMPKAQRGAQDDCIRITVGKGKGGGAGNGNGGKQNAGDQQNANGNQNSGGQQNAGGNQDANGQQNSNGQQAAGGQQNNGQQNGGRQNGGQQNGGQQSGGQQNDGQQNGGQQNNGQSTNSTTATSSANSTLATGDTESQGSAGVDARGNMRGSKGHHRHRGNRKHRGDRHKNFQRDEAIPQPYGLI